MTGKMLSPAHSHQRRQFHGDPRPALVSLSANPATVTGAALLLLIAARRVCGDFGGESRAVTSSNPAVLSVL